MQKFSEYVNNNQKSSNKNSEKINNESAFELLKRVASKYEGASQEDLISAIMTEAKLAKERGTLSTNEIQNFVLTISPMLNNTQRTQLEQIIKQITED